MFSLVCTALVLYVQVLMVSIPDCKLVLMRLLEYNDSLEIWNGGMGFSPIPYPDVVMNLYCCLEIAIARDWMKGASYSLDPKICMHTCIQHL